MKIMLSLFLLFSCNQNTNQTTPPPPEEEPTGGRVVSAGGGGRANSSTAPGAPSAACINTELTNPSSTTGQFTFSVDSTIDPCTVNGYVVGYHKDLKVKKTTDGTFHIDNIPPGEHDIIVTGTLVVKTLSLNTKKDKAVRIGKQSFLAGVRKEKGKLEIPDVASISGKVTLTGQMDHAGIHVYIPGTGFDATTDTNGLYTITPVPSGINNLLFEKDGYNSGQIEEIKIAAGSETKAPEIQLILSTGANGFVLIDGGEAITSSKSVILTIGATSDAVLMKISENQAFVGADWEPVITRKAYSFASFGEKIIYIKFANENGLESTTYQDSITVVDYSQTGTMSINAGVGYTTSAQVTINLTASGVDKMYVTNTAGCAAGGNWVAYASSTPWTLGSTNATSTVYVKLRDKVGNESACLSDEIIHDSILPVANSISIDSGATYSTTATESLNISATGASEMYVSNIAGCASGGAWEAYSTSKTWTLGQMNHNATVYAKFKDLAGNESSCISDSIIHDNIAPSGASILINGGAGFVTTTTVALSLGATDTNAIQMYITNTSGCGSGGTWANMTSTTSWTLGQTNATATVYVKFKDAAGNESGCISDSIVHDNTAPTFTVTSSYDGRATNMTVTINVTDISQLEMKIDSSAAFSSASYQTFSSPYSMPYTKNIKIQLKDASGNESNIYDFSVLYTALLSQGRTWGFAASTNNKSIFSGGYTGTVRTSVVDIYDADTNTWSTSNLSQARSHLAATSIGTKAIFAGGHTDAVNSNSVDIYDSSNNTWSTAALSQARNALSATTVGTKAIFAGGSGTSILNIVDIYDSSTNIWSTSTLSVGRYYLAATTVGTKAIFAGGHTGAEPSNVVDIYDSSSNTWSTATLSQARSHLAATSIGTKAIFAGGHSASGNSNVIDIYDSYTNTWSTATLSFARSAITATSVGTKAIFSGGFNDSVGSSNAVDIYDSSSNTWSTGTLSVARDSLSATTIGTKAIFAGGRSNTDPLYTNVVDIYDSSTNTWSTEL